MVRGWLDIFAAEDRNLLVTKIGELSTGKRCGPMLVSICPPEVARGASPAPPKAVKVVFNACRIPDHDDVIYCTLTVARSEEHTSELQSLMRISYAVFCLKKKKNTNKIQ